MFVRRSLIVLAAALSVVRCADQPTAVSTPAPKLQFLTWAGDGAPRFTATTGHIKNGRMRQAPPLSLENYVATFWAVRGEARSVQINYMDASGDASHPFLVLTTTDPVLIPGVGELAVGDSVLVTVTVDTTKIGVSLEPNGLQFGTPANLQIFYGGADGDLNGDAAVDSVDAYIEQQLLGLWWREGEDPWTAIPAQHSIDNKSFSSELPHFSEYILSFIVEFLDWSTNW